MEKIEKVVCSAIHIQCDEKEIKAYRTNWLHRAENLKDGFVVCGLRHSNCFALLKFVSTRFRFGEDSEKYKVIQGFMTTANRFVDRNEAMHIAYGAGQVERKVGDRGRVMDLFSEDLY